jgi:hypothetical protein
VSKHWNGGCFYDGVVVVGYFKNAFGIRYYGMGIYGNSHSKRRTVVPHRGWITSQFIL